jgi:cell division protein FtsQ
MPGDFAFSSFNRESIPKTRAGLKIEKGLKRLLIIAAIVLGAEFIWLFGISPCIPFSTIEINSFAGFDNAKVLECAGISGKTSFVSVNVNEAQKLLNAHYLVESARVSRRFPDRLSISLMPRKAVALSVAVINGRQVPLYFDKHGVVFKFTDMSDQNVLPVISGLIFSEPGLGMRLPSLLVPFLHELAVINENSPVLLQAFSEIRISRKPFDGFDLVLYPVHLPVRVILGSSIDEETLRYVLVMLNVIKTQSAIPEEIDFRSIMSPYLVKEVHSG